MTSTPQQTRAFSEEGLSKSDSTASRRFLFEFVKPIAKGIVKTLGPICEVVVHDFADPEHSIVYVEGNVTGRRAGGSVTEIGLAAIRGGDSQPDIIGYSHNTRDGKMLRSSTIMLRDIQATVIGCLCINIDVTSVAAFGQALGHLLPQDDSSPIRADFTDRTDEVLGRIIESASAEISKLAQLMSRDEKVTFVAAIDRRGGFGFQRAVPIIAKHMGVSRTTIYTYLDEARARNDGGPSD